MAKNDIQKRMDMFLKTAKKKYGEGSVMHLTDEVEIKVPVISTGALNLDLALGIGGIPQGRIIEIYGNEGSGKTTLALHIGAEAMKKGLPVLYIDTENALDPAYAKVIGLDTESGNFILSQPDDAETALQLVEDFATIIGEGVVVIDSVAAMVTRQELQGDIGDATVAVLARLLSQTLRRLTKVIADRNTALIFLNQVREKVGVMYGNPETTPGGRALKFYSSVRMEVRRKDSIKQGTDIIGHEARVKIVKNKLAPPYKEATIRIIYGKGIDKLSALIETAMSLGVIERAGSFYKFGDETLAQGKESLRKVLEAEPELQEKIRKAVYNIVAPPAK
jgi:recombination protein RecA